MGLAKHIDPEHRLEKIGDAAGLLLELATDLGDAKNPAQSQRNRTRTVCAVAEGIASVFRQIIFLTPDAETKLDPKVMASLRRGARKAVEGGICAPPRYHRCDSRSRPDNADGQGTSREMGGAEAAVRNPRSNHAPKNSR
jgi:hypothetical protein